ncbi:MAG: hypothetical protein AAGC57_06460 [Pseudomonadota bacterium]
MPNQDPSKTDSLATTPIQRKWGAKVRELLKLKETPAPKPGPAPVTREENARLAALSPQDLAATDLTHRPITDLFDEGYMDRLRHAPIKGEDDPTLRALMREVEAGVSGARRAAVMAALARIVGEPPTADTLDTDYGRFLILRQQRDLIGAGKEETATPLDADRHPDFTGSRAQLMFGTVIGDAFGIHPVFAALLSPTGGLVGPGNWLIPGVVKAGHLAPDNPLALHGVVHDAGGYLLKFHDQGPGYNYRESKVELLGPEHLLTGHLSGIAYWVAEAGDEFLVSRLASAVMAVEAGLSAARDALKESIERSLMLAKSKARAAIATVTGIGRRAKQRLLDIADAIEDAREAAPKTLALGLMRATKAATSKMRLTAKHKFEAAWSFVRS